MVELSEIKCESEIPESVNVPALLTDQNLWNIIDQQLGTTILEDKYGRLTTFLVALTAFGERPAQLLLLGESATGKTWMALKATELLPTENIQIIGSSTERAWFYSGKHYEVDWTNKVIVVLDNVTERTIKALKPVMSHDNPGGTIDVHVTMKNDGKYKTETVKIHGCPAFINCSTMVKWDQELTTRHFFLTPRDDKIKYSAAADLIQERAVTGKEPIGPRVEEVRKAIKYLVDHRIKVKVKSEVASQVRTLFDFSSGHDVRNYERALTLIETCGWLHAYQREHDNNGTVIADEHDLTLVQPLLDNVLPTSRVGTSYQVIALLEKVLKPLAATSKSTELTIAQIRSKYTEVYGRPLPYSSLNRHVEVLEELGKVEKVTDSIDHRRHNLRILDNQDIISTVPTPSRDVSTIQGGNIDGNNNSDGVKPESVVEKTTMSPMSC